MRSEIGRMTLEKTFQERDTHNQAVVRIVIKAARVRSIECLQYEIRDIVLPASVKTAMRCRRKPSTANVGTTCRVKEISRAKSIWHGESNKIATVLSNSCQFKIQAYSSPRYHEQGIVKV